jgi:hypothetical protein
MMYDVEIVGAENFQPLRSPKRKELTYYNLYLFKGVCGMSTAVGGTGSVGRCVMRLLSLVVIGSLLSGCATIISGSRQKIDIITSEEGAKVEIINQNNNKVFEQTTASFPTVARLKRGDGYFSGAEYRVEISKEGSEKRTAMLQTNFNAAPYLSNIILAGWVGWLIVDPITGAMWKFKEPIIHADLNTGVVTRYSRSDGYFAARYWLPAGVNLESGWVWGNGTFFGIDFGIGPGGEDFPSLGGGFNLGGVSDLPVEDLQVLYGGSLGIWVTIEEYNYYDDEYGYNTSAEKAGVGIFGPFVKFRWKFAEISYRMLLGKYSGSGGDFGIISHQIMAGIYLESDNRWKGKPKGR